MSTEPERAPLDRLVALDPTGIMGGRLVNAARRVPGVSRGEEQYGRLERALLRGLMRRLNGGEASTPPQLPEPAPPRSPADVMDDLLRQSIAQTPDDGERALVEMIVRELVPDEARILAALADGTTFPLVHVGRSGRGAGDGWIVSNVSSVGRAAGVVLPERVPAYIGHMLALSLVLIGAEGRSFSEEYDILLTDPAVIAARASVGRRRARVHFATLRVSELGSAVWAACRNP